MEAKLHRIELIIKKSWLLMVTLTCFSAQGFSANLQISGTVPNTTVNTSLLVQLYPLNGTGPFSFGLATTSGNLPDGVTLSTSGVLSGLPKEVGSYPFTVELSDQATLADPASVQQDFTLYVTPPELNILTTSIPGLVFDTAYDFQLLGEGGSGNYLWNIANGALPNGFSLGSTTGLLSGNFNLLTTDGIGSFTFTVELEDRDHPISGNALYDIRMATDQVSFTISPDTGSYCWEIYKTGSFHVARSHHLGDYCYIFFEGIGVDIYFGTENQLLDEPSEVTVDGVAVTPTPVDGLTREWTSAGHTEWVRYRIAENLTDGKHIVKMVAPTSMRNTVTATGTHIGGRMTFESLQVQQPFYRTDGTLSSRSYYVQQDVLPDDAIYRCGEHGPGLEVVLDPDIKVVGNKISFEAFPQATIVVEAQEQNQLAENALTEIEKDQVEVQSYLTLAEEAESSANISYGQMLIASDNATLQIHLGDIYLIAGNASQIELDAATLGTLADAFAVIAGNASSRTAELAGQDISANDLATRTALASAEVTTIQTAITTMNTSIAGYSSNTQDFLTLATALAAAGVSASTNTSSKSGLLPKPKSPSFYKPPHATQEELVQDVLSTLRGKAPTEESVPYLQLYNEQGERTGTLFGDHNGDIPLPEDGTLFKVSWGNPDDVSDNFATELTSPDEARSKFGSGTSTSGSSSASSSLSSGGGGGGGGCLFR